MKKITLFLVFLIVIQFLTNCKKNDPINPAPVDTATITQTWTISETHTVSPVVSPTATSTSTMTNTPINTPVSTIDSSAFVSVSGGTFMQCSFNRTISAFNMGKYEVTYELWYTVYQWAIVNGYSFANAGEEGSNGTIGLAPTTAKYEPVTMVNWRDVIVWCNAYSQKSGLTPVYWSDAGFTSLVKNSTDGAYASSVDTTSGSYDNPYVNWSANGYRLPTEGEWQYAASYKDGVSWTPDNYASGATADYNDATATGLVAWYVANAGNVTHNVGNKTANATGIHDMSGNVWEWCWDWYDFCPSVSTTDYRGSASGSFRVLRGGSFNYVAPLMQLGRRDYYFNPYFESFYMGFRLARTQ